MSFNRKSIDDIRAMKWSPKFHGEVPNKTAEGGAVDMWEMVNADTGETLITVGVPKGRSDIAGYIAACCGNPVRWVTAMPPRADLTRDGVHDPEGILHKEYLEISDVIFKAFTKYLSDNNKPQANGWTLNDALSAMWYAFCAQLPHAERGLLLFRFLQLATTDYQSPEPPERVET